jgi:hypothetical protein
MTKRIDTHAHLGECCVFGLLSTEEDMLRRMEECKVDATIVQPYPGATVIAMLMNAKWSAASRI